MMAFVASLLSDGWCRISSSTALPRLLAVSPGTCSQTGLTITISTISRVSAEAPAGNTSLTLSTSTITSILTAVFSASCPVGTSLSLHRFQNRTTRTTGNAFLQDRCPSCHPTVSFFLLCMEMLPSMLRPLVGPMRNPTSPNGLKSLRGFCKPQKSTPVHTT